MGSRCRRAAVGRVRAALVFATLASVPLPLARAIPNDVWTEVTLEPAAGRRAHIAPERLKAALERRVPIVSEGRGTVFLDEHGRARLRVLEPSVPESQLNWLVRPGVMEVVWLADV